MQIGQVTQFEFTFSVSSLHSSDCQPTATNCLQCQHLSLFHIHKVTRFQILVDEFQQPKSTIIKSVELD